jgi:WD40 repeat protein
MSGHANLVRSIDFGQKYLVSGSWDQTVKIWDKSTGKCLMTSTHQSGPVTGVILRESDQFVLVSSRDGFVRKLDIDPSDMHHILKLDSNFNLKHDDCVMDMALEDKSLLTACSDGKVVLWNISTQETLRDFRGHKNGVRSVFIRGDFIASGGKDHFMKVWSISENKCIRSIEHHYDVRAVAFNSSIALSSSERSDVYVWDMKAITDKKNSNQSDILLTIVSGHNGFVHSIYFTPTCIISCDITGLIYERDAFDCLHERTGFRILKCPDGVNCMTCDSENIVCGLLDKTIRVFKRSDKTLVTTLYGHTDHIWTLDQDSRILASGSWDGTVRIWLKQDWKHLFTFIHPDSREISGIKIHNKMIYVGCLSGSVAVITEEAGRERFLLKQIVHTAHLEHTCQGGVYALDIQHNRLISSHAKVYPSLQEWNIHPRDGHIKPVKILFEKAQSESIIWSIHLAFPLALLCHDNEILDVYHLETDSCLR